jgi:hypothetical protein
VKKFQFQCVLRNNTFKQTNKMLWDSTIQRRHTTCRFSNPKGNMFQIRTKRKNINALRKCSDYIKSGHSSYVTNGRWDKELRPGRKPTSPRSVWHISPQHRKNGLASLLVQGHPVERKKFYISAGSGCRLADKVVSIARQRTRMTCFKDFQNPTGSRVPPAPRAHKVASSMRNQKMYKC